MKGLWLSVVLLLLGSCAALQSSRLPNLTGRESIASNIQRQTRQRCEQMFVSGNWQFVHSITFTMANGRGATVIGVTVLEGEKIKTGLMTVEGFVLFEAELDNEKKLHVSRALPPFDTSRFGQGLLGDVQTIFLRPPESTPAVARLATGYAVCRYDAANGEVIDVIPAQDGGSTINVYDADHAQVRSITTENVIPIEREMIPENIQLRVPGARGYTLKMSLISADKIKKE